MADEEEVWYAVDEGGVPSVITIYPVNGPLYGYDRKDPITDGAMEMRTIGALPLELMRKFCQKYYGQEVWVKDGPGVKWPEPDTEAAKEVGQVMAHSFIDELGKLGADGARVAKQLAGEFDPEFEKAMKDFLRGEKSMKAAEFMSVVDMEKLQELANDPEKLANPEVQRILKGCSASTKEGIRALLEEELAEEKKRRAQEVIEAAGRKFLAGVDWGVGSPKALIIKFENGRITEVIEEG